MPQAVRVAKTPWTAGDGLPSWILPFRLRPAVRESVSGRRNPPSGRRGSKGYPCGARDLEARSLPTRDGRREMHRLLAQVPCRRNPHRRGIPCRRQGRVHRLRRMRTRLPGAPDARDIRQGL